MKIRIEFRKETYDRQRAKSFKQSKKSLPEVKESFKKLEEDIRKEILKL